MNVKVHALPHSVDQLARLEGWTAEQREVRTRELTALIAKLGTVSPSARKLLTLVAEQAPAEPQHEALMPRLHEACGLDPEEMDRHLAELRRAGLVRVDGQYPFEQIAVTTSESGWDAVASLIHLARECKLEPREAFAELDFGFCGPQ